MTIKGQALLMRVSNYGSKKEIKLKINVILRSKIDELFKIFPCQEDCGMIMISSKFLRKKSVLELPNQWLHQTIMDPEINTFWKTSE